MLEKLYELLKQLLGLSRDVKQHDSQIKELQDEMETVISAVQDLAFEIRRMRENETHEREKMVLRLEKRRIAASDGAEAEEWLRQDRAYLAKLEAAASRASRSFARDFEDIDG